jgi:hypothetical protein
MGTPNDERAVIEAKESLKRRAAAFLRPRIDAVTPVTSAASFESADAVKAAGAELAQVGLSESDAQAAMSHAAAMMHHLFVEQSYDATTAWRTAQGYEFFPPARLRQEPVYRDDIERVAGRRLRDDEKDSKDLWRLYWMNGIAKGPRVVGVDQTPSGVVMFAWKSTGLATRTTAPSRRSASGPIMTTPPETPGSRVELWRGAEIGQGWPLWFPPDDVEARLEQPGVRFIEIAWVVKLEGGVFQPFVLDLGMDPMTRRWWIMQWSHPHLEPGAAFIGGGV